MAAKRLIAGLGCIGFLAVLVGLYGFIRTGAYEEFIRSGTVSTEFLGIMFSRGNYRPTIISILVALVFAGLDICSLTSPIETIHSREPQPMNQPLGFLAVRARRYFLVLFAFAYIALYDRTLEIQPGEGDRSLYRNLFVVLFLVSRRPINTVIINIFYKNYTILIDAADSFIQGQPVRRSKQGGARR